MRSTRSKVSSEIIINKSRFVGTLFQVRSETDISTFLEQIRKEHPGANHNCYAYIMGDFGEIQKASDDGEPNKTAGVPILEILKKNDMTDVLAVITRYFGGIKLGAGGLIRAYAKTTKALVDQTEFATKKQIDTFRLVIDYSHTNNIERILKENVISVIPEYLEQITYLFEIDHDFLPRVEELLQNATNGMINLDLVSSLETY